MNARKAGALLVRLAKREALLRRVIELAPSARAEREELREILDKRAEIMAALDVRKV